MKRSSQFLLLLFIILFSSGHALSESLSGEEILRRIDANYYAKSRVSEATMKIKGRRGTRTVTSKSWAVGTEKAFTEYLAPAREKGTKMLKIKDELWTWTPSTDRTIKIAGHMLRQSLLGSDISYEDFMEDSKLIDDYTSLIVGEEILGERPCHILELTAKTKDIAYNSRKIWVDKERFLPLKEQLYAKSGKLIKSITIHDVFKVEKRWYPKRVTFKDVLKKGDGTELIIDSIEFDIDIPDTTFSKASLHR